MAKEPVVQRDTIVVGASAGGVEALQRLVADLPPEVPASILVVLHLLSSHQSVLDSILERAGDLAVSQAKDGERLERGHVYVAPPDRHLLVLDGHVRLSAGPRENGHRPAVDPLFRSAARAFGARVIGVILSGTLDDGTDGIRLVKDREGATIVQDPDDAQYDGMPRSAIAYTEPDRVVPIADMAETLCEMLDAPLEKEAVNITAASDPDAVDEIERLGRGVPGGEPSNVTCPDCGGVLWEHDNGGHVRYACQVGHGYSPASLEARQSEHLEAALWSALRSLEERADLLRRIGRRSRRSAGDGGSSRYEVRAEATEGHAAVLRETIMRMRSAGEGEQAPDAAA